NTDFHALRGRIERLAELHDVDTMLTERRTDRRARIGLAGRHLERDVSFYFLCHMCFRPRGKPRGALRLFHLAEVELDRRGPTETPHRNPALALFVIDVLDDAAEVVERPIGHANDLARLEENLRPRLVHALLDPVEDRLCLALRDRRRAIAAATDEAQDLRH